MSKFQDFYVKASADAAAKKELAAILDGKAISQATDAQLEKISAIAKRLGFDITVSEAKEYLTSNGKELSEGDLDAVAGGGKVDGFKVHNPGEIHHIPSK